MFGCESTKRPWKVPESSRTQALQPRWGLGGACVSRRWRRTSPGERVPGLGLAVDLCVLCFRCCSAVFRKEEEEE